MMQDTGVLSRRRAVRGATDWGQISWRAERRRRTEDGVDSRERAGEMRGGLNGRGKDGRSWRRLLESCKAEMFSKHVSVAASANGGGGGGSRGLQGGCERPEPTEHKLILTSRRKIGSNDPDHLGVNGNDDVTTMPSFTTMIIEL